MCSLTLLLQWLILPRAIEGSALQKKTMTTVIKVALIRCIHEISMIPMSKLDKLDEHVELTVKNARTEEVASNTTLHRFDTLKIGNRWPKLWQAIEGGAKSLVQLEPSTRRQLRALAEEMLLEILSKPLLKEVRMDKISLEIAGLHPLLTAGMANFFTKVFGSEIRYLALRGFTRHSGYKAQFLDGEVTIFNREVFYMPLMRTDGLRHPNGDKWVPLVEPRCQMEAAA